MSRVPVFAWRAAAVARAAAACGPLWGLTSWVGEHHLASRPGSGGADTPRGWLPTAPFAQLSRELGGQAPSPHPTRGGGGDRGPGGVDLPKVPRCSGQEEAPEGRRVRPGLVASAAETGLGPTSSWSEPTCVCCALRQLPARSLATPQRASDSHLLGTIPRPLQTASTCSHDTPGTGAKVTHTCTHKHARGHAHAHARPPGAAPTAAGGPCWSCPT